jgi:hypothetical protein
MKYDRHCCLVLKPIITNLKFTVHDPILQAHFIIVDPRTKHRTHTRRGVDFVGQI